MKKYRMVNNGILTVIIFLMLSLVLLPVVSATSGSASFQEASATVGDTIHADFTWADAVSNGGIYATMFIIDPDNNTRATATATTINSNPTDSFTLNCTTNLSGTWIAKINVWDGSQWLTYTDTLTVSPPANQNPVASYTYTTSGLLVTFDPSGSHDPDGTVNEYDWDYNNDGAVDSTRFNDNSFTINYSSLGGAGTYTCKLTVYDNDGASGYTTHTFTLTLPTSGSASFQESSATVGDTIHADFTWADAVSNGGIYATMFIIDPDNNTRASATATTINSNPTDSFTLNCTTNLSGTWIAKINVWDGSGPWLTYTDTLTVNSNGSSSNSNFDDWFTFLLNLPFYVIILIIAVVFLMAGSLAFFIKPEVIGPPGNLGIVPSVATLFVGILAIMAIIIWYANLGMIYVILCAALIAVILILVIKYFFIDKKRR